MTYKETIRSIINNNLVELDCYYCPLEFDDIIYQFKKNTGKKITRSQVSSLMKELQNEGFGKRIKGFKINDKI